MEIPKSEPINIPKPNTPPHIYHFEMDLRQYSSPSDANQFNGTNWRKNQSQNQVKYDRYKNNFG